MVMKRRTTQHSGHAVHVLVGKYKGAIPLAGYKCTAEDNDKKGLKKIDWEGVYWMYRVQDRRE
jgi:hypothetical protein